MPLLHCINPIFTVAPIKHRHSRLLVLISDVTCIFSSCSCLDLNPHRLLLYVHETKSLVLTVEGSNLQKLLSILNDVVFVPLPAAPSITSAFFKYNGQGSGVGLNNDGKDLHVSGLVNGLATVSDASDP